MTVAPQDGVRGEPPHAEAGLQPFLHDASVTLRAPSFAISHSDGQISGGVQGFYHGDRRALSRLETTVPAVPNAPVGGGTAGADRAWFRTVLRGLAEHSPDPAVTVDRARQVEVGRMTEILEVVNAGRSEARLTLTVRAASDLAPMSEVRTGAPTVIVPPTATADGFTWSEKELRVALACSPPPDRISTTSGVLVWDLVLPAGSRRQITLSCVTGESYGVARAAGSVPWQAPVLTGPDHRFADWLRQSHDDLSALLLANPDDESDLYLAAGAPWYLTLFGRDSLWAARMLLPLGTRLAEGTLRTLARRQGTRTDPGSEEQPGKILHELRSEALRLGPGLTLPPCYYGTVDATLLWIVLLHDAWRWGMPADRVEELLPNAQAALEWMAGPGDADGDGFLEYVDATGRGLSNQGWKDSGDGVQSRDAVLAEPPIALCEVQGYAYEAAVGAAALLRAFDRPDADRWEEWAYGLRERFRARFWVEDQDGPYPAIALDRHKRPIDSVTSNMGHLLGTGLLDQAESALIAARLTGPELASGFGLRTLSSDAKGFNPLGYHTGSVWPHDTAIAAYGLSRAGYPEAAATLVEGLLKASSSFGGRLPELFSGHAATAQQHPSPYPAACRPQAWSAASSVLALQAVLGLQADVPGRTLTVSGMVPGQFRSLKVTGLALAGQPLHLSVGHQGIVHATTTAKVRVASTAPPDAS